MSFSPFAAFSPFGRRRPAGFDPLSLSPALWLDGADASTMYDAVTGGGLVPVGGSVARWEDKSGYARHATQTDSAKRPTRLDGGGLLFPGSKWLATVAFGGTETWSRWVVFTNMNAGQYKTVAAHAATYQIPSVGADYFSVNWDKIETFQRSSVYQSLVRTPVAVSPVGVLLVARQRCNGTNQGHSIAVNGVVVTSGSPPYVYGPFTKPSTAYGVGAYNGGGMSSNCKVYELIHVPGDLSGDDVAAVDAHLMQKWGIST